MKKSHKKINVVKVDLDPQTASLLGVSPNDSDSETADQNESNTVGWYTQSVEPSNVGWYTDPAKQEKDRK